MTRFRFSSLLAVLSLALVLSYPTAGFAVSEEVAAQPAAQSSEAANEKDTPVKAAPGAKRDETNTQTTPPAAEPTPQENEAAVLAADAITQYDETKVIGHARPWQLYYQPATTPVMKQLEGLQDFVLWIITFIVLFVLVLLAYVCVRFRERKNPVPNKFAHNTTVEILWTVIPILILVAIGIPSVRAHSQYTDNQNIINNPDMTLKVVGNQWYWSYEYPEYEIAFDSNIVPADKLQPGQPRLLTVDNPIVIPVGKVVRVQATASDVIHNWAVPSFGVKQDVVPGRLNETWFKAEKEGIYYGQCSELCGKFHGFMPIQIHVVSEEDFETWVAGARVKYASNGQYQFAAQNQ